MAKCHFKEGTTLNKKELYEAMGGRISMVSIGEFADERYKPGCWRFKNGPFINKKINNHCLV